MIEVEIRGRLTQSEYEKLKTFLAEKGKFLKHLEREMILLKDYPGYKSNLVDRDIDIRLRNTSGECEIMVKRKAADNNLGREEISLKLQDKNLATVRKVMTHLGLKKGKLMQRTMDVYEYKDIEWQVVSTPKGLWYWEAEKTAQNESEISKTEGILSKEAEVLGLQIMTPQELREFIETLDREVNVEIDL